MPISSVSFMQRAAQFSWPVLQYGTCGALGFQVTAKIVHQIAPQHPFFKKAETPLCFLGGVCGIVVSHIHFPATFVALCIAYAVASRFGTGPASKTDKLQGDSYPEYDLSSTEEVTTHYTPDGFRDQFGGKVPFPANRIVVNGKLILQPIKVLKQLPKGLCVKGDFDLSFTDNGFLELPEDLKVEGDLKPQGVIYWKSIPRGVKIRGNLILQNKDNLRSVSEGVEIGGDFNLLGSHKLISLPEQELSVGGSFNLTSCKQLSKLPRKLCVGRDLNLSFCENVQSLSEELEVGRHINLTGCTSLKSLLARHVKGNLDLNSCTGLTSLPPGLKVDGDLILTATNVRELPADLQVKGKIIGLKPI